MAQETKKLVDFGGDPKHHFGSVGPWRRFCTHQVLLDAGRERAAWASLTFLFREFQWIFSGKWTSDETNFT